MCVQFGSAIYICKEIINCREIGRCAWLNELENLSYYHWLKSNIVRGGRKVLIKNLK